MTENGGTTILAAVEGKLMHQSAIAHINSGYEDYSDYSDYSDSHHDDDEENTRPEDYGS